MPRPVKAIPINVFSSSFAPLIKYAAIKNEMMAFRFTIDADLPGLSQLLMANT